MPPLPVVGQVQAQQPSQPVPASHVVAYMLNELEEKGLLIKLSGSDDAADTGYRLRAASCLFTYNSAELSEDWWEPFVAWLQTLEFVFRWTATMETSLRSGLEGRLHLHVFMEFNKAVDWTGLRAVTFNGVRPNAQATAGRGAKMREMKNHGHFYVFADKASAGLSNTGKGLENRALVYEAASSAGRDFEGSHIWV